MLYTLQPQTELTCNTVMAGVTLALVVYFQPLVLWLTRVGSPAHTDHQVST